MRSDGQWVQISFGEDKNALELIVVIVAQFCEHTKNQWIEQFRRVNYVIYELHHNKAVLLNPIYTPLPHSG